MTLPYSIINLATKLFIKLREVNVSVEVTYSEIPRFLKQFLPEGC